MGKIFRAFSIFSIPMMKPHTTSTLFLFCRLFSRLADETQNTTGESKLSSEQIFFCSTLCELASLLMYITWSETTQEKRKAILSSSAFTQCKVISSAKSCVCGVFCVDIITLSNALQSAAAHILFTKMCTPVDSKACASFFVMLAQDQVLCL